MARRANTTDVPTRASARLAQRRAAAAANRDPNDASPVRRAVSQTRASAHAAQMRAYDAAVAIHRAAPGATAQRRARRGRGARKPKIGTAPGKLTKRPGNVGPKSRAPAKAALQPSNNKRKRGDDEEGDEDVVPAGKRSRSGPGKVPSVAASKPAAGRRGRASTRAAAKSALQRVILNVKKPGSQRIQLNVGPPPAEPEDKNEKVANGGRSLVKKSAIGLTLADLRWRSDAEIAAQRNSRAERAATRQARNTRAFNASNSIATTTTSSGTDPATEDTSVVLFVPLPGSPEGREGSPLATEISLVEGTDEFVVKVEERVMPSIEKDMDGIEEEEDADEMDVEE